MGSFGVLVNDGIHSGYAYKINSPVGTFNPTSSILDLSKTTLKTVKLLIEDNIVVLPSPSIGDIVWNMAAIFETAESTTIISEVTVTTNGLQVYFEPDDNVNGNYCVLSYYTTI